MLTGNEPPADDLMPPEDAPERPAIVTEVGSGLDTFSSDEAFADWLVSQAVERWSDLFGQQAYGWSWYGGPYLVAREGMPGVVGDSLSITLDSFGVEPLTAVPQAVGAASSDSSSTNTQIAGVDEADLVETDGDTLYTLVGGRLSIVRGFADGALELVSQVEVDAVGHVAGMYLHGERLTIVSRRDSPAIAGAVGADGLWRCPPVLRRPQVIVTVLDVSDPTAVAVFNRTTFDGSLVASRMVDGQLRLVLNHDLELPAPQIIPLEPDVTVPMVDPMPNGITASHDSSELVVPWVDLAPIGTYETADAYAARVRRQLVEAMTPQVYQVDAAGNPLDVSPLLAATRIDIPEPGTLRQLTTVTAFDVTGAVPRPVATTGLFTRGTVEVFATTTDLFLFDGHNPTWQPSGRIGITLWQPPVTTVTKLGFGVDQDGQTVSLLAQGRFTGRVLNQFAADERDGFLRVVVEVSGQGSGVLVLEQQGERLVEVGSLSGFAPREDLYSVRIVGNRAYFVTFRQTDPLFVVDLSTPTAPTLLGELKVPGFSDHIQPLGENHLLTIGRDADEATGIFKGMQVSIFDVTDPASPSLLHRHTLAGGRGTSTIITGERWRRGDGDHLALGFFPDQGVITIPVRTDGFPTWDSIIPLPLPLDPINLPLDSDTTVEILTAAITIAPPDRRLPAWQPPTQHLEVLSFDIAAGISSLGRVDHDASIDRSVQIAGFLVAVSASEVSMHSFTDPDEILGSVQLNTLLPQPIAALPAPVFLPVEAVSGLLERAVAGLPVNHAWVAKQAETVGDRTVVYAEHVSGAVHRFVSSGSTLEQGWAAFGFEGIGNLESRPLSAAARGSLAEAATELAQIRSVLSDALLERLDLFRDADGRLRRRGPQFSRETQLP